MDQEDHHQQLEDVLVLLVDQQLDQQLEPPELPLEQNSKIISSME